MSEIYLNSNVLYTKECLDTSKFKQTCAIFFIKRGSTILNQIFHDPVTYPYMWYDPAIYLLNCYHVVDLISTMWST
jgi:hypothetical protein